MLMAAQQASNISKGSISSNINTANNSDSNSSSTTTCSNSQVATKGRPIVAALVQRVRALAVRVASGSCSESSSEGSNSSDDDGSRPSGDANRRLLTRVADRRRAVHRGKARRPASVKASVHGVPVGLLRQGRLGRGP